MINNQAVPFTKRAGLSMDEADLVGEILAAKDAHRAYLKVVRKMVENMEGDVVKMSSSLGAEALFQAKLKAEGARKLLYEMEQLANKKA